MAMADQNKKKEKPSGYELLKDFFQAADALHLTGEQQLLYLRLWNLFNKAFWKTNKLLISDADLLQQMNFYSADKKAKKLNTSNTYKFYRAKRRLAEIGFIKFSNKGKQGTLYELNYRLLEVDALKATEIFIAKTTADQSADQSATLTADQSADQSATLTADQSATLTARKNSVSYTLLPETRTATLTADQSATLTADQSATLTADQSATLTADQSAKKAAENPQADAENSAPKTEDAIPKTEDLRHYQQQQQQQQYAEKSKSQSPKETPAAEGGDGESEGKSGNNPTPPAEPNAAEDKGGENAQPQPTETPADEVKKKASNNSNTDAKNNTADEDGDSDTEVEHSEVGGDSNPPAPNNHGGKVPKIGTLENAVSAEIMKTYSRPSVGHAAPSDEVVKEWLANNGVSDNGKIAVAVLEQLADFEKQYTTEKLIQAIKKAAGSNEGKLTVSYLETALKRLELPKNQTNSKGNEENGRNFKRNAVPDKKQPQSNTNLNLEERNNAGLQKIRAKFPR